MPATPESERLHGPTEAGEIAKKLRKSAGLPDEPTGVVAHEVALPKS